jgi:squalene-hopene/tetraprenyl-beta-curcumene cyclase
MAGTQWLLDLQNRDGGWPTFCRGWGKLPFDRSGSDITAHAMRGLLAWRQTCPLQRREQMDRALDRGFRYLKKQQRPDGSWLPLWFGNQDQPDDENPFYGTAKVLMAYRDAGRNETLPAVAGYQWLVDNQNADGGWGGGRVAATKPGRWSTERLGTSSVEETALCTEALLGSDNDKVKRSALAGVRWLLAAVESDVADVASPIGFYFAKLWYFEKLYPMIFTTAALQQALQGEVAGEDN